MKQLLIYLISLITILSPYNMLNAQSIKVTYCESIKAQSALEQVDDPQIAALIERELKNMEKSSCLIYNSGISIYKPNESFQEYDNSLTYKDFKTNKKTSLEAILDRNFLIKEDLTKMNWQLVNETQKILGYNCKKAINDAGVIAWYCPEFPISDGPASYYGLAGIILKLESNAKIYTATDITTQDVNINEIQQPTKGKNITREEFDKTKAEKLKSLGVSEGVKGVKVIRM